MAVLAARPVASPLDAWLALGEDDRVELVGGRLIPMEPVSEEHADAQAFLVTISRVYADREDHGKVLGENYGLRTEEDTIRLPDVTFYRRGGDGRLANTHAEGPADLVIEVTSPSTRCTDRGAKFEEYEAAGVGEYWIVDPLARRVEAWARDGEGVFRSLAPDAEGRIRSTVLPGFFLRPEWIWARDTVRALRELGVIP